MPNTDLYEMQKKKKIYETVVGVEQTTLFSLGGHANEENLNNGQLEAYWY